MRSEQFAQIQPGSLLQEFGFRRMRGIVTEGDQHRAGQVDYLSVQLEHSGGSLDLGFKSVRGRSEPAGQ